MSPESRPTAATSLRRVSGEPGFAPSRRKRVYPLVRRDPPPLDLEGHVPFKIAVLSNLLRADRDPIVRGLTDLPGRELRVLISIGGYGPIGAADIAYQSRLGTHQVSRAVATLVHRGLIDARPDAIDQRRFLLTLTGEGEELYAEIAKALRARAAKLTAVLTSDEEATLISLLTRLEDSAEEVLGLEVAERLLAGEAASADQRELLRWYRRGAPR